MASRRQQNSGVYLAIFLLSAVVFLGVLKISNQWFSRNTEIKKRAFVEEDLRSLREKKLEGFVQKPMKILRNSTFYTLLQAEGVLGEDIMALVAAAEEHVDLTRLRRGFDFTLLYSTKKIELVLPIRTLLTPEDDQSNFRGLYVPLDETRSLFVLKESPEEGVTLWSNEILEEAVQYRYLSYVGEVQSSLWQSAKDAKMDPELIAELTEIFAWQIDFAREVQPGDRWRLILERGYVGDKPIKEGRILAAEYENLGERFQAVYWDREKQSGYYFPDGRSLRRLFLKSPIRFARISSRFSRRRFHPVLKRYRAHRGVDYAAAPGTPIRSVGNGKVTYAQYNRGGGKTIKIRHNSVYSTNYLHMSRFAKGVRRGSRVKQGQVIGYVGSTGLATGPHLHFEFWENGRYVDPLGRKFPSADPVLKEYLAEYKEHAQMVLLVLPVWEDRMAAGRALAYVSPEKSQTLSKLFR